MSGPAQNKKDQSSKNVAECPFPEKSQEKSTARVKHPLIESVPRNLRIGGDIRPKVDLSRYVKWPRYICLQRQRRVLQQRLKIPPALNQFNHTINRNQASQLFKLLNKYKPETKLEKKARIFQMAKQLAAQNADGDVEMTEENPVEREPSACNRAYKSKSAGKPIFIKYGLNHVTDLVEYQKAKLVVIAHDVDPIELVCWLPALCRKKNVVYCIAKGKARLGQLVRKKNAAAICLETVRKEDQAEFENLVNSFRAEFNENLELRRKWGGGILGKKSQQAAEKQEKRLLKEGAQKNI